MRILMITLLSLTLIVLGIVQVQGKKMDSMDGETDMSQTTDHNSMMDSDGKTGSGHKMESDGMMDSEQKMKSDDMMESDDMKKDKDMMHDQSMAPKHDYTVPSNAVLREQLTPLQYRVTREEGTEPAFNNTYWNNHEPGIYVDLISGVPLFSSTDKYDSGTGWPSFTKPLDAQNIVEKDDRSFFMVRTEVRTRLSDAHLGHVFADGPAPTGLRYCMNSAALRFVPVADLNKEGYGEYANLFK